jgi:hypothetical protein
MSRKCIAEKECHIMEPNRAMHEGDNPREIIFRFDMKFYFFYFFILFIYFFFWTVQFISVFQRSTDVHIY